MKLRNQLINWFAGLFVGLFDWATNKLGVLAVPCGVIAFLLIPTLLCVVSTTLLNFIPERMVVNTVIGTVTNSESSRMSNSKEDLFLITLLKDDGSTEVFQVSDSIWWWHFQSADTYFALKQGGRFKLTVTGWRLPMLSQFRNVVEYKNLPPPPQ